MRTYLTALSFAGFAAVSSAAQSAGDTGYSTVRPVPLDLASKTWAELQFIDADLQGRVFVLRGSPVLETYRLEGGSLRFVAALEGATAGARDGEMWVERAQLRRGGDGWFLFVKPTTLEIYEGAKRTQTIESHWEVTDLAQGATEPVVSVSNSEINTSTPEGPGLTRPPLVRRWDGKRWETLIQGEYRKEEKRPAASEHLLDLAAYSARLALTPTGQLWVAGAYAPRLRHFSASGVIEDEIVLGNGEIRWLDVKADVSRQQQDEIDAARARGGFRAPVGAPSTAPQDAYRGLAFGREGYVYLLAETEQGLALDRYLPSLPTYERVLLGGVHLGPGRPSFVAGRHGLVVGARFGKEGTWEIPYEDLATAEWKNVRGVTRNGVEIETSDVRVTPRR